MSSEVLGWHQKHQCALTAFYTERERESQRVRKTDTDAWINAHLCLWTYMYKCVHSLALSTETA